MKLAIFGHGGHAREVAAQINQPIIFFVDDDYVDSFTKPFSEFNPEEYQIMIAIADPEERERVVNKMPENTRFFTYIHPSAKILDKNIFIGRGSFIGLDCVITTNVKIGKFTILNRGVHIGHDCVIGDYFSAMPGSIVSGNVTVGDNVYIGTNSSIKEKINICSNVKIGLNTGVIRNIKQSGVYAGCPAKKIK